MRWAAVLVLLACNPAPPQGVPLLASLRLSGLALRPQSRPTRASPPPLSPSARAASVPPQLSRPEELRLLAERLDLPPSLGLGCTPVDDGALRACLGRPLPPPLQGAAVLESVHHGQVLAATAEEGFPDPALAEARFQSLQLRLRQALGAPRTEEGQLLWRPPGHRVTLEIIRGSTSFVSLDLRRE
ncbi:MAG: hypothetical protein RMK29_12645 [Myxococcales bacterium]|nr:hypothetical protein [Myxococcota bacterium]MDW8282553.1 hypothetical protein [Myxococcales bacterium]